MLTINQIAELAGVSRGTVDRVINKRGGVSQTSEIRVAGIIKQYGYRPNKVARALVKRKKRYAIGVISASSDNIFFKDVIQGIRRAESELEGMGVSLRYREVAMFSVNDQLRCLNELLAEGIDALAINPITAPRIRARLREATGEGIPVITFNSDIEGVDKLAYIGCDYRKSGQIATGLLAIATGANANTAVVVGSMKSLGHSNRVYGAREEMRRHPGMRIAEVIEMYDDDLTSYTRIKDLLTANSDIDAFFFAAAGKEGGLAAITECRAGRMPHIVTVDADPFTCKCLRNGTVVATVCQQPFVQGYEPVWQLANYLLHGDKPASRMQYTQAEIMIRQSLNR